LCLPRGNAGSGSGTVGAPGTAKNVITVGAAENVRSLNTANGGNNASGNDGCAEPDTGADNANDIISFRAADQCADQRKKPDIVAPGTHVTGGLSHRTARRRVRPGSAAHWPALMRPESARYQAAARAGSSSNFFPLSQQFFAESSGTSHSTPALAGCCAPVAASIFINNGVNAPSPAMTKAYLMNSAR